MRSRRAYLESVAAAALLGGCLGGGTDSTTTSSQSTTGMTSTGRTGTTDRTTKQPREETAGTTESTQYGGRFIYVDSEHGELDAPGTRDQPLARIPDAVAKASPGDTVRVRPGEYWRPLHIGSGGEPERPITITGPPDAVLRSRDRVYTPVRVRASHVHLTGLTITGRQDPSVTVDSEDDVQHVSRGQLVQLRPPTDTDQYLRNVKVMPHAIGYSQKALVSIERTKDVEVGGFEIIGLAGAKYYLTGDPGHNAEIVYIGTSPSNLGTDWHPWTEYDQTRDVHVHHVDNTAGHRHSELANTKLGTRDVVVEYCTDGGGASNTEDGAAAAIRFQSFDATARWNVLADGSGHAVEIGSYKARDAQDEKTDPSSIEQRGGTDNAVYGNRITGFDDLAVAFPVERQGPDDQRAVCGNEVEGETDGAPDSDCDTSLPSPTNGIGHEGGAFER